eukprot:6708203-Pyramimonas_sp.AAC.1
MAHLRDFRVQQFKESSKRPPRGYESLGAVLSKVHCPQESGAELGQWGDDASSSTGSDEYVMEVASDVAQQEPVVDLAMDVDSGQLDDVRSPAPTSSATPHFFSR